MTRARIFLLSFSLLLPAKISSAQTRPYSTTQPLDMRALSSPLPDVLTCTDGTTVNTPQQWQQKRRPELIKIFTSEMYGVMPGAPKSMRFEVFDTDHNALNGMATRKQVAIYFTQKPDGPRMDLLIYLPDNPPHPVPVIFGLNFWGNHAIVNDPAVRLTTSYVEQVPPSRGMIDLTGVRNNRATDASRGSDSKRWPIEEILSHGYGLATAYRGDLDPDLPTGFSQSIKALYPELQNRPDNFSTIGAWAWGMQRAMDYLQTDPDIDHARIAAFGWSRLGKAAVWAAATDERFAALISSESAAGGAKLFHHDVAENITRLNTRFPHWYCQNFRKYNGKETTMPFDQHEVLALIAPRPLYVASSQPTAVFDPLGEFLAAKAAEPVYQLLNAGGLPADSLPPVNVPAQGTIAYHWRTGKHDVTDFDWTQYLVFLDRHFKAT